MLSCSVWVNPNRFSYFICEANQTEHYVTQQTEEEEEEELKKVEIKKRKKDNHQMLRVLVN